MSEQELGQEQRQPATTTRLVSSVGQHTAVTMAPEKLSQSAPDNGAPLAPHFEHDFSRVPIHSETDPHTLKQRWEGGTVAKSTASTTPYLTRPDRLVETPILRQAANKPNAKSATTKRPMPIMRRGQNIPGGAILETVNVSTATIIGLVRRVAGRSAGRAASSVDWARRLGPLLDASIANLLSPRSIPFDFIETSGLNVHWTGSIRFEMGNPVSIAGSGSGSVSRTFGGSGTVSTTTTESETDSGNLTGGATAGTAEEGGEATIGGELGTSTTRTEQQTTSATTRGGGSASLNQQLNRFEAPLIVKVTVYGTPDFSGSDFINPFKWGFSGVGSLITSRESDSITSGSITYFLPQGIIQPRSWIEHELGITAMSRAHIMNMVRACSLDPVQFSRAGAQSLPAHVASGAERHHAVSLDKVRLIYGGQANTYCNSMNAAAFCTPSFDGGSDIFVHSNVALETQKGQHTLQHEIAHAVQHLRGKTTVLNGLGGDERRRSELEKEADSHADAMLSQNHAWLKITEPS